MLTVLAGRKIPQSAQRVRDDQGRTWSRGRDGEWHDDATGRHHQNSSELSARSDLVVLDGDPVYVGEAA